MSEMDVRGDERPFDEAELPIEAPEADAAEQQRQLREEADRTFRRELPLDVDPADMADQERIVDLDDEDYR
ncbi:hypothetical protein [Thermoactinospora rubra]|uniref:hypothetical protein n=1 Tax=Thermoactinospora rubra TaxID=1088767 RepID=UPI001F0B1472|nr:hypothetical protein [Thermoactinospora rubra]